MVCRWQITLPAYSLKCPSDIQMFLFEEVITEQNQRETPEISPAVKCMCFIYL